MERHLTESEIYKKCREYLGNGERSPLQLENWFAKNFVAKNTVAPIIHQMKVEGFFCEERYLANIRDQLLQAGYPKKIIKKKLLSKKFSPEKIEIFLEDMSNMTILTHTSRKKRLENKDDKEITSFFLKRGFTKWEIIDHIKEIRLESLD